MVERVAGQLCGTTLSLICMDVSVPRVVVPVHVASTLLSLQSRAQLPPTVCSEVWKGGWRDCLWTYG